MIPANLVVLLTILLYLFGSGVIAIIMDFDEGEFLTYGFISVTALMLVHGVV